MHCHNFYFHTLLDMSGSFELPEDSLSVASSGSSNQSNADFGQIKSNSKPTRSTLTSSSYRPNPRSQVINVLYF